MEELFTLLAKILSQLPSSFIVGIFTDFAVELSPIGEYIRWINYFVPFYILVPIFSAWSISMFVLVNLFLIFDKLEDF